MLAVDIVYTSRDNKTANINVKKTVVYLQLITAKCTSKTAKIMNGDITLEAR